MTFAARFVAASGTAAGVQAYAGRTLQLLQAIEQTIDHVTENRDLVTALGKGATDYLAALEQDPPAGPLDPEGRVCRTFAAAISALERMHQDAGMRRAAAATDRRLRDDDGVVDIYDSFLQALSDAHDAVHEVKEWIETHDALLEPATGGTYADATDLIDAIISGQK